MRLELERLRAARVEYQEKLQASDAALQAERLALVKQARERADKGFVRVGAVEPPNATIPALNHALTLRDGE